jgi:hypothetical protein
MLGSGLCLALGCSPAADANASDQNGEAPRSPARTAMIVHRDPTCGCCVAWAEIARKAGYQVAIRDNRDMAGVKRRLGVPGALASCHTVEVGGYVVEGHVPLDAVELLIRERPTGVRGIAVPGMPIGSPGMEVPDGTRQPFQVIAFDARGRTAVFSG